MSLLLLSIFNKILHKAIRFLLFLLRNMLFSQLPWPPSIINLQSVIFIAGILSPLLATQTMNPGVTGVE